MRKSIAIILFAVSALFILFALASTFAAITQPHPELSVNHGGAQTGYNLGYKVGYLIGRIATPAIAVLLSIFLIRKGQAFLKDKVNLG